MFIPNDNTCIIIIISKNKRPYLDTLVRQGLSCI